MRVLSVTAYPYSYSQLAEATVVLCYTRPTSLVRGIWMCSSCKSTNEKIYMLARQTVQLTKIHFYRVCTLSNIIHIRTLQCLLGIPCWFCSSCYYDLCHFHHLAWISYDCQMSLEYFWQSEKKKGGEIQSNKSE